MATVHQRGSSGDKADRNSVNSVAANTYMVNISECVLHDGTISPMIHCDKKVIMPAFKEELTEKKTCWLAKSRGYDSESESFGKEWISKDDETAEMAVIVPEWLWTELSNVNEDVQLFVHVAFWKEGPKATAIEEETWWRSYWSEEAVFVAKKRQNKSKITVDPCDSWMQRVQEMCKETGQDFCYCRISDNFERGPYEQR